MESYGQYSIFLPKNLARSYNTNQPPDVLHIYLLHTYSSYSSQKKHPGKLSQRCLQNYTLSHYLVWEKAHIVKNPDYTAHLLCRVMQ